MATDWKAMLKGVAGLRVSGAEVSVSLADDRQHVVAITEDDEALHLFAIVARSRDLSAHASEGVGLWQRHRAIPFVRFGVDRHGRLVGQSWVPKPGLEASELQFHVRHLATECDRFEHALTGRDVE